MENIQNHLESVWWHIKSYKTSMHAQLWIANTKSDFSFFWNQQKTKKFMKNPFSNPTNFEQTSTKKFSQVPPLSKTKTPKSKYHFLNCLSSQVLCKIPKIPSVKMFSSKWKRNDSSKWIENPKVFLEVNQLRPISILSLTGGTDLAVLELFADNIFFPGKTE